ncbi:PREDICTED: uncharacterized protein LOC105593832 [Cercocebus atys]|uniref:uncharacterized protein LOC105593832 n=1 Tax=Cercocebus atys TaxID=9531 RepID=UPI0005F40073|nr:PREDICTED: uncharacterized protein LOC105593832 [Cercocebus atys]
MVLVMTVMMVIIMMMMVIIVMMVRMMLMVMVMMVMVMMVLMVLLLMTQVRGHPWRESHKLQAGGPGVTFTEAPVTTFTAGGSTRLMRLTWDSPGRQRPEQDFSEPSMYFVILLTYLRNKVLQAAMDVGFLGLSDVSQSHSKTLWGARGRGPTIRRQREFMPEEKKDTVYWEKRRKNNEAAKRSREKRRLNDAAIEGRLAALMEENALLRGELKALKLRFGLLPLTGGPRALPLQALLWEAPWTGDPRPGAEALSSLVQTRAQTLLGAVVTNALWMPGFRAIRCVADIHC